MLSLSDEIVESIIVESSAATIARSILRNRIIFSNVV